MVAVLALADEVEGILKSGAPARFHTDAQHRASRLAGDDLRNAPGGPVRHLNACHRSSRRIA
jgi:hypothetical protein